ncbi:MAG: superoxide dismutase family protein [Sphingobium sp.]
MSLFPQSARLPLVAMIMVLGACSEAPKENVPANTANEAAAAPAPALAVLKDASGKDVGTAQFVEEDGGVSVEVSAVGITPGVHGTHVHMVGKCDAPDFKTAEGHWNPTGHQHGLENPQGSHKGDLPNMDVAADGTGTVRFMIPGAVLSGGENALLDSDGAALVIHAGPDDMKSDPAGNSGDRVACGVILGA